jgi:hypothetical protein
LSGRWCANRERKSEGSCLVNDTVLLAGSIAARSAGLPTQRSTGIAEREFTSGVVIAVSRLASTIVATNDDGTSQRIAGTISTIGISVTGDCIGGRVDGELRAGESGGKYDKSGVLHFDWVFKVQRRNECLFGC